VPYGQRGSRKVHQSPLVIDKASQVGGGRGSTGHGDGAAAPSMRHRLVEGAMGVMGEYIHIAHLLLFACLRHPAQFSKVAADLRQPS
jgi:hypothetical protein